MRLASLALVLLALVSPALLPACGGQADAPGAPTAEGWHEFEGSWSAAGRRKELHLGADRMVAVLQVTGTLLLSGPSRPSVGFRGEAVTLADEQTGLVGRAVWTDEHGDQVFSELSAEVVQPGTRITGTFVGGTGRFAGATGGYEFQWQYLIESDDGVVQGRALGLRGRVRVDAEPAAGDGGGGPR
ncbi:MAG TPA: hypothetical protein VFD43_09375 [Planctomycetota bacterium]|nr:hypothetical protein [Planctomycetota bacterium]